MERLPKLIRDPWHRRRYLLAVGACASQRLAAAYARVDRRTLQRTLARARREGDAREQRGDQDAELSPHEVWLAEVERAEAEGEVRLLAQIQLAGEATWQAFAWVLERRRAPDYSLRRSWSRRRSRPSVSREELVAAMASARSAASRPT